MKILLSTRSHNPAVYATLAQEIGFDGVELVMPSRRANESFAKDWSLTDVKNVLSVHAPVGCLNQKDYEKSLQDTSAVAKQTGAHRINIHPPSMAQTYGGRQNILQGIQAIKEASQQHE
jgi:hypothetical protein